MPYINDPGHEVPENTIAILSYMENDGYASEIILPLSGFPKREWFAPNFYHCLPLVIGNQYGFGIRSLYSFTAMLNAETGRVDFAFDEPYDGYKQEINDHFGNGIITITNRFLLRTPPGINLMTIQPPNAFIPGLAAMTGVVEADNIRMSFTFNLKITIPNFLIRVEKGDMIAAFIPIPRYMVENYKLESAYDLFDSSVIQDEHKELEAFSDDRKIKMDKDKDSIGRYYYNGKHFLGGEFKDHQKKILGG